MQTITTKEYKKMEIIKMVENSIKQAEDYPTETKLWFSLRKKITRRSLRRVLEHLESEKKIMYGKGRRIIWTEADELQSRIVREEFKIVR
jgi:hypothetical protein